MRGRYYIYTVYRRMYILPVPSFINTQLKLCSPQCFAFPYIQVNAPNKGYVWMALSCIRESGIRESGSSFYVGMMWTAASAAYYRLIQK